VTQGVDLEQRLRRSGVLDAGGDAHRMKVTDARQHQVLLAEAADEPS
jgi:hypothetical protein